MQELNTDPGRPKPSWGAGTEGAFKSLLLPEESQGLSTEICLWEDFCLWYAFIYQPSSGFHPSAPLGWLQAPTDWAGTGLGRYQLLWTVVCSSTSGLCFPVSRSSHRRWPKLSLSFCSLFSRWWGLIQPSVSEQPIAPAQGTQSQPRVEHPLSILHLWFCQHRAGAGSVPLCHARLDQ